MPQLRSTKLLDLLERQIKPLNNQFKWDLKAWVPQNVVDPFHDEVFEPLHILWLLIQFQIGKAQVFVELLCA